MKTIPVVVKLIKFSKFYDQKDFYYSLLSIDEKERSNRFFNKDDGIKFSIGRAILRLELAAKLNLTPEELKFEYSEEGKPSTSHKISFNVSHTKDYLALVIADNIIELGIDIEKIDIQRDIDKLARKVFTQEELLEYANLTLKNGDEKCKFFFQKWSIKEAILKAMGSGLLNPMEKIIIQNFDDYLIYTNDFGNKYYAYQLMEEDMSLAIAANNRFSFKLIKDC